MSTVNMLEAKSSLSRLVDAVESGVESEIIIARNGKPAAKLVPLGARGMKMVRFGHARGKYPPLDYEAFQALDAEVEAMFFSDEKQKT
jgi:prevent-host-death family protein